MADKQRSNQRRDPPPMMRRPRRREAFGRAENPGEILGRLWGYLRQQTWSLLAVMGLVILTTVLNVAGPALMGFAIDRFILQGDLSGLARISLMMLAIYLSLSAGIWSQDAIAAGMAQRVVRNIRRDLFDTLQTLSLRYFDRHSHGDLMSRLTNDVENISNVLTSNGTQFVSNVLTLIGVVTMMLVLNVPLALVTFLVIPAMTAVTQAIAKRTRKSFREQQRYLGDLNGIIEENVGGLKVVKAFCREEEAITEFNASNRLLRKAATRAGILSGFVGPLMNMMNNIDLALVAGAGGWLAVQGLATIGTIATFVSYARQFSRPLNHLAQLFNVIQSALAGAERVFEVMDETPDLADKPGAKSLEHIHGKVTFEDVCFSYEPGEPVLKDITMYNNPGETIALVGPTGAGKTTMINLLTRFYDVDSGSIRIDSEDIRDIKMADLRSNLGLVLQNNFLFADTVIENIRYGRLDASDEEVMEAAKLANAHTFIHRLPKGYQTELSERGANLSQGQRQLIAIARALLVDPDILILDEATSSVDTRTEKHLQEALLRLMDGRTSFVIAHRLSTIRNADIVMVIREGEIIERGTHRGLMEKRGFYHTLYMSQFKGANEMPAS